MSRVVAALLGLASLVETSASVRSALSDWSSTSVDPVTVAVSRRALVGLPLAETLQPLRLWPEGGAVARAIEAHALHGGSLATTLRAVASSIEGRERIAHTTRAAVTGSRLTSRLLGGIGIACIIGFSLWQGSTSSSTIVAALFAWALTAVGAAWWRKLTPKPPNDDRPAAAMADLIASLLEGGLSPAVACEVACGHDPRSVRLVRLGATWSDALGRNPDEEMKLIAQVLGRTVATGAPASKPLCHLASTIRSRHEREAEIAARRAPVLLVLPLTLCFLPAFGLVILVPMLRGMSG